MIHTPKQFEKARALPGRAGRVADLGPQRLGYTLFEMILVIAIVASVIFLAVPHFAGATHQTLQSAARSMVSDISYAQSDAMSSQARRKVIFDVDGNSYRVVDGSDVTLAAPWMGGTYQIDYDEDSRFNGVKIKSVNFNSTTTLTFSDLGAPSSGGTIELTAGDQTYTITVASFTGRITVDSGG